MTAEHETNDSIHESLMTTAMSMAEETPDMMDEIIAGLEQKLIPLYEASHAKGDTGVCMAIDGLWQQVQALRNLAINQALGVASAGIVATAYKMHRDEALLELGRMTEAYQQIMTLMKSAARQEGF